jgi:hypothetical protein
MWMRLAAHSDVGYIRGVDQAYYRVHGQNMTTSRTDAVDLQQRRLAFEAFLSQCGENLPDAAELSDIVHRKISQEALWRACRAYDRGRTSQVPTDELVAFALDCWADAERLAVYRTLQLRKKIGPQIMPYLQPFIWSAVVHRARSQRWWHNWERNGVG